MEQERHTAGVKRISNKAPCSPAPLRPEQIVAAMERAVQRLRHMSHQQRLETLKDAGILTARGKLAASYR